MTKTQERQRSPVSQSDRQLNDYDDGAATGPLELARSLARLLAYSPSSFKLPSVATFDNA